MPAQLHLQLGAMALVILAYVGNLGTLGMDSVMERRSPTQQKGLYMLSLDDAYADVPRFSRPLMGFSNYRQHGVGPANEKRSESEFDDPRFFSAAFGKRSGSGVLTRYGPWGSGRVWNRQLTNF